MDYHTMSLDIVQLLNDLRLHRVDLLGHSMGGKIAMTLALTKPDLIGKLIVEDISPTLSLSAANFPFYVNAMKKVTFDSSLRSLAEARRSADEQLHKIFTDRLMRNFILTNIVEKDGGQYGWRVNLSAIGENMYEILDFPHFDTCFYGRCLFIGGANSSHISEPFYSDIHRLFPRAQIQHIEGAGHWVHSEKPYQFMEAVHTFLQSAADSDS
jgi:abhydrolase domain-containing protein 11